MFCSGLRRPSTTLYPNVQVQLIPPAMDHLIDVRSHLTPDHRPNKTHQTIRFPQIAAANGLHHDEKSVVNFIVQLLFPSCRHK